MKPLLSIALAALSLTTALAASAAPNCASFVSNADGSWSPTHPYMFATPTSQTQLMPSDKMLPQMPAPQGVSPAISTRAADPSAQPLALGAFHASRRTMEHETQALPSAAFHPRRKDLCASLTISSARAQFLHKTHQKRELERRGCNAAVTIVREDSALPGSKK